MVTPSLHLILHNALCIISAIAAFGAAYFTYTKSRKTANLMFALTILGAAVFLISHVIGVNVSDPHISRDILMFNLVVFFIAAFNLHAIFAFLEIDKKNKAILYIVYIAAFFFVIFFLIFPDLFLLPSVPKMYFPNYYNPGVLNWVRLVFHFGIIVPYTLAELYMAHKHGGTEIQRKRDMYFFLSILAGYTLAFIPNFLVYDIPIDPLLGTPFVLIFALPFIYGAVKYEVLDIQVIAQQAFWYSLAVGVFGGFITFFNYMTTVLVRYYPSFPSWASSLFSGVLVVTITVIIWRKLREGDLLKYEFITTVTHKFRTPLTHIKWAAENLRQSTSAMNESDKQQIEYIEHSNGKLVELTNLLMNVSEVENTAYDYHLEKNDLSDIVTQALRSLEIEFESRKVTIQKDIEPGAFVMCDPSKIRFVVQTFLENAVNYSPNNPLVKVSLKRHAGKSPTEPGLVTFAVKDNGIGISNDDMNRLFAKFYRTKHARLTDTEGMGIGLYICKEIVNRHKGRISVESGGEGKGSTFSFEIPELVPEMTK